ncbi:MAG TPA: hypothetical protein VJJ73_01280 [Candidatus Paceibacterota bacterium]
MALTWWQWAIMIVIASGVATIKLLVINKESKLQAEKFVSERYGDEREQAEFIRRKRRWDKRFMIGISIVFATSFILVVPSTVASGERGKVIFGVLSGIIIVCSEIVNLLMYRRARRRDANPFYKKPEVELNVADVIDPYRPRRVLSFLIGGIFMFSLPTGLSFIFGIIPDASPYAFILDWYIDVLFLATAFMAARFRNFGYRRAVTVKGWKIFGGIIGLLTSAAWIYLLAFMYR